MNMITVVLLIFAAVFLSVLALFLAVNAFRQSPAAELKRRLRSMKKNDDTLHSGGLSCELFRETAPVERFIFQLPVLKSVKKQVEHSGVTIKPGTFLVLTSSLSVAGFVALYVLQGNSAVALMSAALIASIPFAFLGYRKQQRQTRFSEQLPDALTMIARSLRAGHSLTSAVELVSQELPEPTGGLFKIGYEQQKLGMRIAESLETLLDKIDSVDLRFFVTIIKINSETGGNLSEILEKLADTMRSRLQIRRQVQTLTAEGRLSGYVLLLLPVFVFIAFYLRNPGYMEVFFVERVCQISLVVAGFAQVAGFLIIRKIVAIRI